MKSKRQLVALSLVAIVMTACAGNDRVIEVTKLPQVAQNVLTKEFSNKRISFVKADRDVITLDYNVVFDDGSAIEFDAKGQWEEIHCRKGDVPSNLIPEAIRKYVSSNYPAERICQIEKQRKGYEIELTNGLELEFDKNFRVRDIDD